MLENIDVIIWFEDLSSPDLIAILDAVHLPQIELARAASFKSVTHRRYYTLTRKYLRLTLSKYLLTPPDSINFFTAERGKPYIDPIQNTANISFNISHSDRFLVVVIVKGEEVGIDVELIKPVTNLDELAKHCMSSFEYSHFHSRHRSHKLATFYRIWTRKEAYLKALGMGLYRDPQSFTLPLATSSTALPIIDNESALTKTWFVQPLNLFTRHACICSLVTTSEESVIKSYSYCYFNND